MGDDAMSKWGVDTNDLILCDACFCCLRTCCCKMGTDLICCTVVDDRMCFQIGLGCCDCGCLSPSTCVKSQAQCLCLAGGCAFPCDDDMPCMLALLGLACLPSFGCCQKISTLKGKTSNQSANSVSGSVNNLGTAAVGTTSNAVNSVTKMAAPDRSCC